MEIRHFLIEEKYLNNIPLIPQTRKDELMLDLF